MGTIKGNLHGMKKLSGAGNSEYKTYNSYVWKEWKGSGWRKPGAAEKGYSAGAVAWGTGMQSLSILHTAGSKSGI